MSRRRSFSILTALALSSLNSLAQAGLEVHEWGTFTSLVGSNGVTQNGMYHEDEALPDFVHGFGETALQPTPTPPPPVKPPCHSKMCFSDEVLNASKITQKMETPVIYFYSEQPQHVKVDVRFPDGIVTETYPAPVAASPSQRQGLVIANGRVTFQVQVLAATSGVLPNVDANNIYAHARKTDSNLIRSGVEQEKFIFYRGLGRFQPRFSIQSMAGALELKGLPGHQPQAAFLVHVDSSGDARVLPLELEKTGRIEASTVEQLQNHAVPAQAPFLNLGEGRKILAARLVQAGLFAKEAQAMLDTWENGYLKVPGLRLLYILPRTEVDEVLPLVLSPAPQNLARVFVGRIEILVDTEEAKILSTIQQKGETFDVRQLGRFAEPVLHRVLEIAPKADTKLLQHLIDQAAHQEVGASSTAN